jgi:hypothetical protein
MVVIVTGADRDEDGAAEAAGGGVSDFEQAQDRANRPHTRERFIVALFQIGS